MKIEEIRALGIEGLEQRTAEIRTEIEAENADIDALSAEVDAIEARKKGLKDAADKKAEIRSKVAAGAGTTQTQIPAAMAQEERGNKMNEREQRAQEFVKTGKMEVRGLLATGKIAKPSKVDGINDLPEVAPGIVDDVHAIPLEGYGTYTAAYKATEATAADHKDGTKVGGTGAGFDTVDINPTEWGVLDSISKMVKKQTPLNYQAAIEESAVIALRVEANKKIVAAILASKLAETKLGVALDEKFVRGLLLGFRSNAKKGGVKLYINQADLQTLGAVRGTDKKPVYEIEFDAGTNLSGVIRDGGSAVAFRVVDELAAGTQLFGQPGAVDMPMWGDYTVETDEGGNYFDTNQIGIKGLQTAGADLVSYHGMQIIKQATE